MPINALRRMDTGYKLTALIVLLAILSLGLLIYMVDVRVTRMVENQTREYVEEAAETASLKIDQMLEGSLLVARGIMANAQAVKAQKVDRAAFLEMHKQMLEANPELLGTWSGWEPNALDGDDAGYVNTRGHDMTGRFVPYWYRTKTGVDLTPLIDYDKPGPGDYYQVAKQRQRESVLEPYSYNVDGEDVLITSFSVPIIRNNVFLGVAGVDYSLASLQKTIGSLTPMGEGRVALISSAGTWVVPFKPEDMGKAVKDTEPEIDAMREGATGKAVKEMKINGLGVDALTVVTPVDIGATGQQWFVVVAIPVSVVTGPLEELSIGLMLLGVLAAGVMAVVCGLVVTWLLGLPLRQIIDAITQIGRNNFNVKLTAAKREDDIGTLAKAIDDYKNARANEVGAEEEKERQRQREKEVEERRKAELQELGARFSLVVGGNGDEEGVAGGQPNFSTVAASTNEMFEAINSIARQMSQVQDTVNRAVSEFGTVESDFNVLKESSEKINEVIGFIGEIASRTNLLSLNASIEAARAGEAGRGFSIVAEEVKNLAGLTTKATDSIAEQVQGVQEAIRRSVGSIQNISATVAQINQSNMTVAAAVEEQTNTTKEISSSVQYIKEQATDLLEHIRKG